MKHFMLLRLPFLVLGMGAALLLTPSSKAQSEVSPDHFDGTDSWAAAAQTPHTPTQKQVVAKPSFQAKSQKNAQSSALQLALARDASKPVSHDAVAAEPKRNTAPRKPEKQ